MNKKFQDITRRLLRHKQGLRDPQIMHPEREWVVGLILMSAIFAGSAFWSVHVYVKNRNITAEDFSEEKIETLLYREGMVKEALNRVAERDKTLQTLIVVTAPAEEPIQEEVATSTEETVSVENQNEDDEEIDEMATSTEGQ